MCETSNNSAWIITSWVVDLYGLVVTIHQSQQQYHKRLQLMSSSPCKSHISLLHGLFN